MEQGRKGARVLAGLAWGRKGGRRGGGEASGTEGRRWRRELGGLWGAPPFPIHQTAFQRKPLLSGSKKRPR